LIDLIEKHLYSNPDKPSKTLKELSLDKPPYFHGKVVWEIKDNNYRIIYEIRYETKEIIIFFVGKKDNKTTSEMMEG